MSSAQKGNPHQSGNFILKPVGHQDYEMYLKATAGVRALGDIPVDLMNPEDVKNRVLDYFKVMGDAQCRPTVTGLAMAFGMRRQRLYEFKTGAYRKGGKFKDVPEESLEEIRKAYDMLENLLEAYMVNDDINPNVGIFYATNHFGYRQASSVEHTITSNSEDERISTKDIEAKYIGADIPELPKKKGDTADD